MSTFFAELKHRNVFKVSIAYTIVAWLLIQVTDTVAPALHLPEWTLAFIVYLLMIGFALALFLAWAYELTPEGIKATASVSPNQSITQTTGQRLNYIILGFVVLVVAFIVVDNYVLKDTTTSTISVSSDISTASTLYKVSLQGGTTQTLTEGLIMSIGDHWALAGVYLQ
jgi:disulfide bond formation protein DsbB